MSKSTINNRFQDLATLVLSIATSTACFLISLIILSSVTPMTPGNRTVIHALGFKHKIFDSGPKQSQVPSFKQDYTIPPVVDSIPPIVTNIQTADRVVFLTIDDGAYKDPAVVKIISDNNIKASLFLARSFIINDPEFFKQLTKTGSMVENHTLSHDLHMVKNMNFDQQKAEICGMADYEQDHYGRRPVFYRPPGGLYSDIMIRAAGACGMRAVVTWIAKVDGGSMQYQVGDKLRPGDIVLMHFTSDFLQNMQAFLDAQKAAGLHTELLEDWIN